MEPGTIRFLTVADWRAATLAGRDVLAEVAARARRVRAESPAAAWIVHVDDVALQERLVALAQARDAAPDPATLLVRLPLFGVPFAVKDNIDVAGLPTTAACPAFAYRPKQSATVVRRLLDAGAVLLGKTNLDQFATGLVGTRSPYGAPSSTWAADRISGGSSSGSAVVVARGDVAFALGTDTAGSGRVPAGFNHLVGLKPTPGRVSTAGVVPACRCRDCVSVFALDVADAATVLSVAEGPDDTDDYSDFRPGPAVFAPAGGRRLRVGVPADPPLDEADGYPAAWRAAASRLASLGLEVVPLDFRPMHAVARLLYEGPWVAERYAVVQALLDERPDEVDPTVRLVIEPARRWTAVDAFRAQYRLQALRRQLATTWHEVDLLMVPTAPGHPSFADVRADPVGANARLGTYTNFVNLLGWSALAVPSGTTKHGLPFGVTLVAPGGRDAALLDFGERWQAAAAPTMGATGVPAGECRAASPAPRPAVEARLRIAVVGAHLSGQPLNAQLTERGATLSQATRTAPRYRLHALAGTVPPKPGLVRVAEGGVPIEVEVWSMPTEQVGSFLALVPPPLAIGSIELADGSWCHGFVCEPSALDRSPDISRHGGWRDYLAHLRASAAADAAVPAIPSRP